MTAGGSRRWKLICLLAAGYLCYHDVEPPARAARAGYWSVTRARAFATAPSGNVIALSCHNCYQARPGKPRSNLKTTLAKISAAQRAGADLIELDLKEEAGEWYLDHEDSGSRDGPRLSRVLQEPILRRRSQLLYLELKERHPTARSVAQLLREIVGFGYAESGRLVVLRAFSANALNLELIQRRLASPEHRAHAAQFRTQRLYTRAEMVRPSAATAALRAAARQRLSGVEFHFRTRRLPQLLDEARALGLGTNVWTLDSRNAARRCARYRDIADALTTDLSALRTCRRAVVDP